MKSIGQLFIFIFLFAALVDCQSETPTVEPKIKEDMTVAPPTTTVAPPTTTSVAPPTTTTVAPPTTTQSPIGNWTVEYDNGTICIMVKMEAQFDITYNTSVENETAKEQEVSFQLDPDSTVSKESNCDLGIMIITFDKSNLTLHFDKKEKKVSLVDITLSIAYNSKTFPNATDKDHTYKAVNQSYFQTSEGKSYLCKTDAELVLSDKSKIKVKSVQVEAFREEQGGDFSTAEECDNDEGDVSDIVPIAVGCALAGLVVIVLIAYLVGRRHKRQKGYESV